MEKESQNLVTFENNDSIKDVEELLKSYNISGRLFKRLLKSENIFVNDRVYKKRVYLRKEDIVSILLEDEDIDQVPEDIYIDVIYEDDDILAVNKEAFMVVHPTRNIEGGTLSNGVANYFQTVGLKRKVRVVTRLDRDTTGVVIFAKNSFSHQQLAYQLENNIFKKYYLALVKGKVNFTSITIDTPIIKSEDGIHQKTSDDGREAITHVDVIKVFDDYSLLMVKIDTGRTHQIRVHLHSIGHPILGDCLYGYGSEIINRQALHAFKVIFNQPRTGKSLTIRAEIPSDMKRILGEVDVK